MLMMSCPLGSCCMRMFAIVDCLGMAKNINISIQNSIVGSDSAIAFRSRLEKTARRRFQCPKPVRSGNWWYVFVRVDVFSRGGFVRRQRRLKLGPASLPEREARKIAAELLRPLNQGVESVGGALPFEQYVASVYRPTELPVLA